MLFTTTRLTIDHTVHIVSVMQGTLRALYHKESEKTQNEKKEFLDESPTGFLVCTQIFFFYSPHFHSDILL